MLDSCRPNMRRERWRDGRWLWRALPLLLLGATATADSPGTWPVEWNSAWPRTDFSQTRVEYGEILSGGPPRDGIRALVDPQFTPVRAVADLPPTEPVIVVVQDDEARAYPLRVLMWHEIVNDVIGERPVIITYCPLCNASVVYDRRVVVDGAELILEFGVSGKLRHSDMIMYDRATESWWQQFTGEAIIGALTGHELVRITSRTMPMEAFRARHPEGLVLAAPRDSRRHYGINPYLRYDGETWPFLYDGRYDGPIPPLAYVVVVGNDAWPLERIRRQRRLQHGHTVIAWHPGMNSALDQESLAAGRDIGYVDVSRVVGEREQPLSHDVTFAFAFKAFVPDGVIHAE